MFYSSWESTAKQSSRFRKGQQRRSYSSWKTAVFAGFCRPLRHLWGNKRYENRNAHLEGFHRRFKSETHMIDSWTDSTHYGTKGFTFLKKQIKRLFILFIDVVSEKACSFSALREVIFIKCSLRIFLFVFTVPESQLTVFWVSPAVEKNLTLVVWPSCGWCRSVASDHYCKVCRYVVRRQQRSFMGYMLIKKELLSWKMWWK